MREKINRPLDSPEVRQPIDSLTQLNRVRLFAALGVLVLIVSESQDSEAGDPIPFCRDLEGHKTPDRVWLNDGETGIIICIVDGDTYDVKLDRNGEVVRIRLWGVDCPESSNNSKCRKRNCDPKEGKKIAKKIQKMLGKGRKKGRVVLEGPFRNNNNRKLSYMIHNGRDLGLKILCDCPPGKFKYSKKHQYEKKARQCGRGGKRK